jgi:hypothetical protein
VTASQAEILHAVAAAFEVCGRGDGRFLAAPHYAGIYAFLNTQAPFWEIFYLYPRNEDFQARHIDALITHKTSLVLINPGATVDGLDRLKIGNTYPQLVRYIQTHFQPWDNLTLPEGFELYYLPQECGAQAEPATEP